MLHIWFLHQKLLWGLILLKFVFHIMYNKLSNWYYFYVSSRLSGNFFFQVTRLWTFLSLFYTHDFTLSIDYLMILCTFSCESTLRNSTHRTLSDECYLEISRMLCDCNDYTQRHRILAKRCIISFALCTAGVLIVSTSYNDAQWCILSRVYPAQSLIAFGYCEVNAPGLMGSKTTRLRFHCGWLYTCSLDLNYTMNNTITNIYI